jgi:chemotaxis family two-component system response regulator Rcp1
MDVLFVEDDPGDIRLAREAFSVSDKPINLHVALDGMEAMAFLRKEGAYATAPRPHLILLDLNLPKMDGRELLVKIKTDCILKAIPTIILTASDTDADLQFCYDNCANVYVKKPKDWESFVRVVRSVNRLWLALAKMPGDNPKALEVA